MGAGARVYDTDFHAVDAKARRDHDPKTIDTAPVHIEEDVWVGAQATILKGVRVGARTEVAAGAVVTRDVPSDVVVAWVPARVIRSLNVDGNDSGSDPG